MLQLLINIKIQLLTVSFRILNIIIHLKGFLESRFRVTRVKIQLNGAETLEEPFYIMLFTFSKINEHRL